ncbi:hypothetical protein C5Y97_07085 [Blastopirellula marina]|uniref:Carboxypeptidase regulatory-like domain-containing protein n=2 Tax=Blastopirellula marina TaxID=124 RepID=A0A2S8GGQ1_9BACT|nr:hypothetical protein C5Y98_07085 [Blastopirellula marina]PQO43639.1 hypothetical protein C5Y93_23655 [Blastopirellula marina]PTL45446.1 hypothetical protein C5Y97_07085 [Blastopirellula marina]
MHCCRLIGLAILGAATLGCGAASSPRHNVAGKISIDGKPLNQGALILSDDQGERVYADIQSDGSFVLPQVAEGHFRASVSVPKFEMRSGGKDVDPARGARPAPVPVPKKYASDDTSGLQFDIDGQTESLTIELKK